MLWTLQHRSISMRKKATAFTLHVHSHVSIPKLSRAAKCEWGSVGPKTLMVRTQDAVAMWPRTTTPMVWSLPVSHMAIGGCMRGMVLGRTNRAVTAPCIPTQRRVTARILLYYILKKCCYFVSFL